MEATFFLTNQHLLPFFTFELYGRFAGTFYLIVTFREITDIFKMISISDPFCLFGNIRETVKHFLLAFPQYNMRGRFLHETCAKLNIPFSLGNLLTDPHLLSSVAEFAFVAINIHSS